jgi:hypothetical protein
VFFLQSFVFVVGDTAIAPYFVLLSHELVVPFLGCFFWCMLFVAKAENIKNYDNPHSVDFNCGVPIKKKKKKKNVGTVPCCTLR